MKHALLLWDNKEIQNMRVAIFLRIFGVQMNILFVAIAKILVLIKRYIHHLPNVLTIASKWLINFEDVIRFLL